MIYLDNAATSFPKPESVYRAVELTQRFIVGQSRGVPATGFRFPQRGYCSTRGKHWLRFCTSATRKA